HALRMPFFDGMMMILSFSSTCLERGTDESRSTNSLSNGGHGPVKDLKRRVMHMNRSRRVFVLIMLLVLAVSLIGAFVSRGVMEYLPFLQARKGNWTGAYVALGVVDQRPWQTAATLAALAQSAEEVKLARDAERLADHEVDQAFSQSLRQASLAKPNLSGKAL